MSSTCVCPTCGTTVPAANDRARAAALCRGKHVNAAPMEVLEFILRYRRTVGISPTLREIASEIGTSHITINEHANALVDAGILRKSPRLSRSLEPVNGKGK